MGQTSQITITGSTTWTAPAGVTNITVTPSYKNGPTFDISNNGSSFLVAQDGYAYGWGSNLTGQIGDGTIVTKSSPVAVAGNLSFEYLVSGGASTFPVTAGIKQGSLYTWGQNGFGQLGDGTTVAKTSPVFISVPAPVVKTLTAINNAFALTITGDLYSWGSNTSGLMGDGTLIPKSTPTLVAGGLKFKDIFGCRASFFGLTTAGQLYAWGDNTYGQLGVGDTTWRSSPTLVLGGLSFASVASDPNYGYNFLGLTTTGQAYAWGLNTNGNIGDNTVIPKSSPTLVLGGLTFSKLVNNNSYNFGLTTAGQAYGWGFNSGLLGDGTVVSARSSPVLVVGGLTWKDIGVSFGLTTSGQAYVWGQQTGDGTNFLLKSSPVAVLGGLTFAKINNGYSAVNYGVNTSGQLYAWGQNGNGQLGLNDVVNRSSPTLMPAPVLPQLVNKSALPMPSSTNLTVVPGTAYSITFGVSYSFFGATQVSYGLLDSMTITYGQ
jgi:alpha-tubulin suppressor-like RCC1 family protein